jgi:hypothetical protein
MNKCDLELRNHFGITYKTGIEFGKAFSRGVS